MECFKEEVIKVKRKCAVANNTMTLPQPIHKQDSIANNGRKIHCYRQDMPTDNNQRVATMQELQPDGTLIEEKI